MDNEVKSHPSYGMISFARTTHSNKTNLFGSSIQHGNTVVMKLHHAKSERNINTDWYYTAGLIAEVELSGSQFADLITSMNMGDGVPCTIRWLNGEIMPECDIESKAETHRKEFASHQSQIKSDIAAAIENVKNIFSKKSINKADKELILESLDKLSRDVGANSEYQVRMFDEQMAKTVTEAKAEIEFFMQNKLLALGSEALMKQIDAIAIDDKNTDTTDIKEGD